MISKAEHEVILDGFDSGLRIRRIRARVAHELKTGLNLIGRNISDKRVDSVMNRLQDNRWKGDPGHGFGYNKVTAADISREVSAFALRLGAGGEYTTYMIQAGGEKTKTKRPSVVVKVMRQLKPRLNSIGMNLSKKRVLSIVRILEEKHGYGRAADADISREVSVFLMQLEKRGQNKNG